MKKNPNVYIYWWPLVYIIKHLFLPIPIWRGTGQEWQVRGQHSCQKYKLLVWPSQSCSWGPLSPWGPGGQPSPWVSRGESPDPFQGSERFIYLQYLGEEAEAGEWESNGSWEKSMWKGKGTRSPCVLGQKLGSVILVDPNQDIVWFYDKKNKKDQSIRTPWLFVFSVTCILACFSVFLYFWGLWYIYKSC